MKEQVGKKAMGRSRIQRKEIMKGGKKKRIKKGGKKKRKKCQKQKIGQLTRNGRILDNIQKGDKETKKDIQGGWLNLISENNKKNIFF